MEPEPGISEDPRTKSSMAFRSSRDSNASEGASLAGDRPGVAQPARVQADLSEARRTEEDAVEVVPAEASTAEGTSTQGSKWECYVIVHSVSKKHNIGMLLRSATAFGVRQMVVVGRRDISTFGNHGTADYVDLKHFYHMKDARAYLKERGCTICGVEIVEGAQAVQSHPFTGHTAFLLGNEGSGLSQQELDFCDRFVYIPQYGAGTASLNVVVAASIILHHFATWANFEERLSSGGKFLVGDRPLRRGSRNSCPEDAEEVLERRRERDRAAAEDEWVENVNGSLFCEELKAGC